MELNAISQFISTCGFPIFLVVVFLIYGYKIANKLLDIWNNQISPVLTSLKESNIQFTNTLNNIDKSLDGVNRRLDVIDDRLNNVENSINK